MTAKKIIGLILFLTMTALSGCGGGGGDSVGPQATVTLTPSKAKALANGSDAVTIQASVKNADGTTAADGTAVNFSIPDNTGNLSASVVNTQSGLASVTLTSSGVRTITVTGSAEGASGTVPVKFISQPASAEVSIAFDQSVANLAALSFVLKSEPGATFDNNGQAVAPMNAASGSMTLVACNFDATSNSARIELVNGAGGGFNTDTIPIIKATFSIGAAAALPAFSIETTPANFLATDPDGNPANPPVTAANLVVTATYDTE